MMDSYSFEHKGSEYTVSRSPGLTLFEMYGGPSSYQHFQVACAEILRLAEESQQIRAELVNEEDERDGLKLAVEEAQEIIGELSAGLAILAGESLRDCTSGCPGHLGPKATEAVDHSLAAWRALQEGNRAALERCRELELLVASEADKWAAREVGQAADARLGRELRAILLEQREADASAPDILRRIIREREQRGEHLSTVIRERDQARADHKRAIEKCQETEGARLLLLADLRRERLEAENCRYAFRAIERERDGLLVERDGYKSNLKSVLAANESIERENRSKCLELAEKAGEIRELREQLEIRRERIIKLYALRRHDERLARLLALLDSEEPPFGALAGVPPAHAHAAQALWRWLREQVGSPPLVAPLNASDAGVIRPPEVKTRHKVGDAEKEDNSRQL